MPTAIPSETTTDFSPCLDTLFTVCSPYRFILIYVNRKAEVRGLRGKCLSAVLAAVLMAAAVAVCCSTPAGEAGISAASAGEMGLVLVDCDGGTYVLAVEEDSEASRMGFRPGDLITAASGRELSDAEEVEEAIRSGQCESFQVSRKGQRLALDMCR